MTLNQLLSAIAKAGYPVTIGFDDDADANRSYPYDVSVNGNSILNVFSEYTDEIESHLLSYAEGPGGSFSFTFDKKLTSQDKVERFNSWEVMNKEHEISICVDEYTLPKNHKFSYEDFPEGFEFNKEKDKITLSNFEKEVTPSVVKHLSKMIMKELKHIGFYHASFCSESHNDEGDFQYEYMIQDFYDAYDIVKKDKFEFFENTEIDIDSKMIAELCEVTNIPATKLKKILSSIIEEE